MIDTFRRATANALAQVRKEMKVRKTKEVFLLFPMGSQFDFLIYLALAMRGVYCLVADPVTVTAADVRKLGPKGIFVSGGPASAATEPPPFDNDIFDIGIPVLGICLGFQMWAKHIGVEVLPGKKKEFGQHEMSVFCESPLLKGFSKHMKVLMSHGDKVDHNSRKLEILGCTGCGEIPDLTLAAASYKHLYGVQFHPEVTDTENGALIFENFCFGICGAQDRFPAENIAGQKVWDLRKKIGKKKVVLALSGGSDSSVVAGLIEKALLGRTGQVLAIYIKGLDRPDDEAFVRKYFADKPWMELIVVDATSQFLKVLKGITDPRKKRKAMRRVYKRILEHYIKNFGASFIAQGTLYTDISESGGGLVKKTRGKRNVRKAQIKLHHHVNLGFSVPELIPLADCVKDGARAIGRSIGVPEELLVRHPFP
ncbi:MAG: gamma-glutamyl-gamma-aminobutyrate hydrolase family protein, partial [Candidatus Pacebacteria bacterium]|nr:gamma-glutamyl-gamma-aminobutyrate hydrolase family protein [Candidatus Paceibacterota bacterium]